MEKREKLSVLILCLCVWGMLLNGCNDSQSVMTKEEPEIAVYEEELEEERRMFYVAMTRAKEKLEILYIQDKLGKKLQPSRFLSLERKPWEIPSAFKRK